MRHYWGKTITNFEIIPGRHFRGDWGEQSICKHRPRCHRAFQIAGAL